MTIRIAISTMVLALLSAQSPLQEAPSKPASKPAAVTYLFPEQVTVPAGKPAGVDLHFKVADGLHVNSHAPRAVELIPTTLTLPETDGLRLADLAYPAGSEYAFADNPQEKLSVYTGEFVVHAQIVAAKGERLMQAKLRYQACSSDTCMPPRTIPVTVDVIAK